MIQISPGHVLAVKHKHEYYYFVVLSKAALFGGNFVYFFPFSTPKPMELANLLTQSEDGLNAFVDFIWAKKENRIIKLGKITNYTEFIKTEYFKNYDIINEKWIISEATDLKDILIYNIKEIRTVPKSKLSRKEKNFPTLSTSSDKTLIERVKKGWSWESDSELDESY